MSSQTVASGLVAAPHPATGRRRRRRITRLAWWLAGSILLAWGLRLALLADHPIEDYSVAAIAVLFLPLLALLPPVVRAVAGAVGRLRRVPRRARGWIALTLAVGAMSYLYLTAVQQGTRLVPLVKDEYSYLLQARMLSTGRLWLRRHDLADFFETTAVVTDRVYASVYPPGTALLFAPGAAIGLPHWVTAMLISGAAVAMVYLTLAALVDDWCGLAGALLLVAGGMFQTLWRYAMAQVPVMLVGLVVVWCFLHWKARRHRLAWAAATGAAAGLGLIIRPQDAVCYVLPVAVAMLLELRRRPRPVLASIVACVVAGAPFLVLQVVTNAGVTGRWHDFPHNYYHRRDLPRLGYGFHDRERVTTRPASVSPQKQAEFDVERAGLRRQRLRNRGDFLHIANHRLPRFIGSTLPEHFLALFLPVGLLALGRRSRWVLAASVPLFLLVYLPWPFILSHYPVPVAPGALLLVLAGMWALERQAGRYRQFATALFALVIAAVVLASLPQVNRSKAVADIAVVTPQDIDARVREHTAARAVVLLRYNVNNGSKMRPYNIDGAWPDDARIIKALDLGARNGEIFAYYAQRQPDREFFLYDFADESLTRLGNAKELAARLPARPSPAVP
jgi:4-amino-4-deoxy-L-arabinose transferase-like glycosyltransferase